LVQIRLWVSCGDEMFFKAMAKQSRLGKTLKIPKRFGRKAKQQQIEFAENLARDKGKEPPVHLYNHHISLWGWILANKGTN
jgi:hypothetical protein